MKKEELCVWLFEHGVPIIRYRTATELPSPSSKVNTSHLLDEPIHNSLVKKCLERLVTDSSLTRMPTKQIEKTFTLNEVHGSKPATLENVIGKLTDFGLKRSIPA